MRPDIGKIGVWRLASELSIGLIRQLEQLGYATVWIGGSPPGDLALAESLLDATEHVTIATGIVNVWSCSPHEVAHSYHRIADRYGSRFLLGIGVGHREGTARYERPYDTLTRWLDELDAAGVPTDRRVLAALGPKVVRLAGARTAGAHTYLTTPEHTRRTRVLLGAGPLLAVEQKVVFDTDAQRARALGRAVIVNPYLG